MRLGIYPISTWLLITLAPAMTAQTDPLAGGEINVIKDYKPVLADAVKVRFSPRLPEVRPEDFKLEYNIPTILLDLPYRGLAVKPLALRSEPLPKLYRTFIRAGYGNLASPLIEVYHYNTRSRKYHYGGFAGYNSSDNSRNIENQAYGELKGGISGKYFFLKNTLAGMAEYSRNQYHSYGYDYPAQSFGKADVRREYSRLRLSACFYNSLPDAPLQYNINVQNQGLNDYPGAPENVFTLESDIITKAGSDKAGGKIMIRNVSSKTLDYSLLDLVPKYSLGKRGWKISVGIHPVMEVFADSSQFHIFPDLEFGLTLIPGRLVLRAGTDGRVTDNHILRLSEVNPFIGDSIGIRNTWQSNILYSVLSGSLGSRFTYVLQGQYSQFGNMPLFVNDTADEKYFAAEYDSGSVITASAGLSYLIHERFKAALTGTYYSYAMDRGEPWHLPSFLGTLDLTYNFREKLYLSSSTIFTGGRTAKMKDGSPFTLNDFIDVNFGIQYRYSKNIGLFCNLRNIGSAPYDLWYKYPSFGFNFVAGMNISF